MESEEGKWRGKHREERGRGSGGGGDMRVGSGVVEGVECGWEMSEDGCRRWWLWQVWLSLLSRYLLDTQGTLPLLRSGTWCGGGGGRRGTGEIGGYGSGGGGGMWLGNEGGWVQEGDGDRTYHSIWGGAYQRQQQIEQILPPLERLAGKVEAMGRDGVLQWIYKRFKELKTTR